MENNNRSNSSSRCRKIRAALANSPAFRAIHRISHNHQQSTPTVTTDSNSPLPQHGAIPIKFDYSSAHGNLAPKGQGKVEPEPHYFSERGKFKGEEEEFEQHDKKDMNYVFSEYIQRARNKLVRTVTNIGKGQSKGGTDEANGGGTKKKDNHSDQISDFIRQTKRKIRTTSSIGKTGSLKRG